jgi:methylmalonyl-CoA mutase cobalamin-binding domain/chain
MSENLEDFQDKLLQSILQTEKDQAVNIISQFADQESYRKAMTELVEPVLEKMGEMWMLDEVTLAQTYVAGKIAEEVLMKIIDYDENKKVERTKGPVIIGNIEDDFHPFGKKMVVIFLKHAGWDVVDLGTDVLADEFVEKAIELKSRVIGVSSMMYSTAVNIKKLRQEIDKRGMNGKIQLAVGGAVFRLRPELLKEVGGDGTTDSALNAHVLFDELWQKSIEWEAKHE